MLHIGTRFKTLTLTKKCSKRKQLCPAINDDTPIDEVGFEIICSYLPINLCKEKPSIGKSKEKDMFVAKKYSYSD